MLATQPAGTPVQVLLSFSATGGSHICGFQDKSTWKFDKLKHKATDQKAVFKRGKPT